MWKLPCSHFIAHVLKSPNYSTLFLRGVFCDLWNLKLQEKETGMSNNLGHLYITVCHKHAAGIGIGLNVTREEAPHFI